MDSIEVVNGVPRLTLKRGLKMYLIVNENDRVLSIGNKAAAFEDKQEALKVISKHKELRLVWKPQHDDDIVLSPKEFDKLINR